jgi:Calcineurin-like phosphoesterase
MADIRFVIVSDLHFGAQNSVLTPLIEARPTAGSTGFSVDEEAVSPLLEGLIEGIRQLSEHQSRPPTLVLAGDILDLALSPDRPSSNVFSRFANIAFGRGTPVFDSVVYYVPGNHDHHLWETAREAQFVAQLLNVPPGHELGAPCHVTRLSPDDESPQISSAWLANLVQRESGGAPTEVRVAYPNMALVDPRSERALVISHGHFTESIYTLMSQLKDVLYPGQRPGRFDDIVLWEQENFAWIDFLWSTLGRSGQVGTDLGLIYADLATPADMDSLAANLTKAVLARGVGPNLLHRLEGGIVTAIVKHEINHTARSERGTTSVTLSTKGQAGLRTYLEGPVRKQLQTEFGRPRNVSFVYGHTHKPFVDRFTVAGFESPVRVFNTGGWVVDTAEPAPVQGGVVVLVDDELEVAPLQVYRQSAGPSPVPVQILGVPEGDGPPSPFRTELAAQLDPKAEPWATITAAASLLTAQRHRLQKLTTAAYHAHEPRSR